MARKSLALLSALALLPVAVASADCSSHPASTAGGAGGAGAFQADPPRVYVAKVKNILVGLPPTGDEIQKVTADPTQLATLIDGWMAMPEYTAKMQRFFELAFQQTQITSSSFIDMMPPDGIGAGVGVPMLVQNVSESFARTVNELIAEGSPLSDAMTTKRVMMTPPLMELYAFLDTYHVDDDAKVTDSLVKDNPGLTSIKQGTAGYAFIPLSATVDPTSPNFMQWYNPDVAALNYGTADASCNGIDPIVYKPDSFILHWILYGGVFNHPAPWATAAAAAASTASSSPRATSPRGRW